MKKFRILLALILGGLIIFSVPAFAMNRENIPGDSVYASASEQNGLYEIIKKSKNFMAQLNRNKITLLKESITPIYVANLIEYAETGVLEIRPRMLGRMEYDPKSNNGRLYMAKTVTAEGLFAGNMRFYIKDGVAYTNGFTPTPVLEHYFYPEYGYGSNEFLVSRSYADHAKRIQNLTGRESFVPAADVRYVIIDHFGEVFYINDGKEISLVVISADYDVFNDINGEIVYIGEKLKKIANKKLIEYKEYLTYVEDWKATNPGELLPPGGGNTIATMFSVSNLNVDNIVNISEYLRLNTRPTSPAKINKSSMWPLFAAIPIAASAILVNAMFSKKKKI